MGLKKPYFNLLVDWLPQVEWPLRENTTYFYVFKKKGGWMVVLDLL
jgi:hypothetical protein